MYAFMVLPSNGQRKEIELINLIQVGSQKTQNNGEAKIEISVSSKDYFVIVTPVGEFNNFFIAEKNDKYFIVKSTKKEICQFDYVVYEKKHKKLEILDDPLKKQ